MSAARAVMTVLRRWNHRLNRRWIADTVERDRHAAVVRRRLSGGSADSEIAENT